MYKHAIIYVLEKTIYGLKKTIYELERLFTAQKKRLFRAWGYFFRTVSLSLITWHTLNPSMNKNIWMPYIIKSNISVKTVHLDPQNYASIFAGDSQFFNMQLREMKIKLAWKKVCRSVGGVFENFCMWMCLPDIEILTFSLPIFVPIYHPSVYQFCTKKTPQFSSNWVLFMTICLKYTQFM